MTARGSDTLAYDQANRLTQTIVGSVTASYSYDGDGKRASKAVGSATTAYLYDVNRGLSVLLEDGTRRYVWGLGLAYEVEGTAALVYHVDGLGSVRALTDSTRAVVQTYESDEFGVPISAQGGASQPFGFTGEQRDSENSLVYLRARYYDAQTGRLSTRDSLPGRTLWPSSLSRFTYAVNRPTVLADPSGLTPLNRVARSTDDEQEEQLNDSECFTTMGGQLVGLAVSIHCLNLIVQLGIPIQTTFGPMLIPVLSPLPPMASQREPRRTPRRNPLEIITEENPEVKAGNLTKISSKIRNALNFTRAQWNRAVHILKKFPGNPDIWVDTSTGEAYDGRGGSGIGNLRDWAGPP